MFEKITTALVICAHPDDEALGAGGTLIRLVSEGVKVHVLFVSDGATSREHSDATDRRDQGVAAAQILGCEPPEFFDFPDNKLDSVPCLELVKRIEHVYKRIRPELVLTHHWGDLNVDHRRVHEATMVACRPVPDSPLRMLLLFEVVSASDWFSRGISDSFSPNFFVRINDQWDQKIKVLTEAYHSELRHYPHVRSELAIKALAEFRGSTIGVPKAEAFVLVRASF